jgi:hypothetical protein
MAKSDLNKKITEEFSKIFDEYSTKIGEITQQSDNNLPIPETDPKSHEDDLENVITSTRTQPEKPNIESAALVTEARRQSQRIIFEAEESARKEAGRRTKVQVDKIMKKAQQDAEEIVESTRRATERERREALSKVQQQSELIIRDITEKARQETQARASQLISNAQEKTGKMMADIITTSSKISHAVVDIVNQARTTISEFESRMQTQTEELAKAVSDSQRILERVAIVAREEEANIQAQSQPGNKNSEEIQKPTPDVKDSGE